MLTEWGEGGPLGEGDPPSATFVLTLLLGTGSPGLCNVAALGVLCCGSQHAIFLRQRANRCLWTSHLLGFPVCAGGSQCSVCSMLDTGAYVETNSSALSEYLRRADPGLRTAGTTTLLSDLTEDHSRREHMKML